MLGPISMAKLARSAGGHMNERPVNPGMAKLARSAGGHMNERPVNPGMAKLARSAGGHMNERPVNPGMAKLARSAGGTLNERSLGGSSEIRGASTMAATSPGFASLNAGLRAGMPGRVTGVARCC